MPCCDTCKVKPAPGTPWKGSPCETCKLSEPSHHGATHISIDAGSSEQTLGEAEASLLDARHLDEPTGGDDPDSIEARALFMAAEILHRFALMKPTAREAVFAVFALPKSKGHDLARAIGVTPQAVSVQLRNALDAVPELADCLPVSDAARTRTRAKWKGRASLGTALPASDAAADEPAAV